MVQQSKEGAERSEMERDLQRITIHLSWGSLARHRFADELLSLFFFLLILLLSLPQRPRGGSKPWRRQELPEAQVWERDSRFRRAPIDVSVLR